MGLPFTALYAVFFLFPTYRVVELSFQEAPLIGEGTFIGLANYKRLLQDWLFWKSLRNTSYFMLLTVIPNTALGLLFALLVVRLKRAKSTVMAALFSPYILPVSVVTLIWEWILEPKFGIAQEAFVPLLGSSVAVFRSAQWPCRRSPLSPYGGRWASAALYIRLARRSKEFYEAASLDGANGWQRFRYVTWPLLWPFTALVLTLQLIAQLRVFDQVYLLTEGGPFNSTIVTLQYVYREAFQKFNGGYASTIAVVLFVIILVASFSLIPISACGRLAVSRVQRVKVPSRDTGSVSNKRRFNLGGVLAIGVAFVLAAFWLFPLYWALITSLKLESRVLSDPPTWFPSLITFRAYRDVLRESGLLRWYFNSIVTATAGTFVIILLCMLCAYAISQLSFPGKTPSFGCF